MVDAETYNVKRTMDLDPAAKSPWEVLLLYPHIKALRSYRIANRLWKNDHRFLARWVSNRARRKTGIEIHPGETVTLLDTDGPGPRTSSGIRH